MKLTAIISLLALMLLGSTGTALAQLTAEEVSLQHHRNLESASLAN